MVNMLATSVVDHDFEPWSGQSKDYKLVFAASPRLHATLKSEGKDWFAHKFVKIYYMSFSKGNNLIYHPLNYMLFNLLY